MSFVKVETAENLLIRVPYSAPRRVPVWTTVLKLRVAQVLVVAFVALGSAVVWSEGELTGRYGASVTVETPTDLLLAMSWAYVLCALLVLSGELAVRGMGWRDLLTVFRSRDASHRDPDRRVATLHVQGQHVRFEDGIDQTRTCELGALEAMRDGGRMVLVLGGERFELGVGGAPEESDEVVALLHTRSRS